MKQIILLSTLFLMLSSCKEEVVTGANFDTSGFTIVSLGGGASLATKMEGNNMVVEQGVIKGGLKNGMWVEFNEKGVVKTIKSYVNGVESGARMEFSASGQMEKKTTYVNNELEGPYGEYKFGKPLKEANYTGGVLNGMYNEYFKNKGVLQKSVEFKNGKQDGTMRYYDEEGNVTLEYKYKDGEKVEGGM